MIDTRQCIVVWVDIDADEWVEVEAIEPCDLPDEVIGAALLAGAKLYLGITEE